MADPVSNDDEDYIRQYGDNPNAPDITPVNAADRAAPYNATQDFLNAAAISGAPAGGVSPGVGQPGSTDITDQTNLNVAAAMERGDLAGRISPQAPIPSVAATAMDEFGRRRQDIETQRTQLMAKLGMIPPSAAGLAAVVLPSSQRPRGGGLSDYEKAFEQLNYLENQSRQLTQEKHYSAIENARQVHEDLARNTHIQVSTGIAKMMGVISQANQQYGVGSPEARAAILSAYSGNDPDIAAARGTKTFEDRLGPYVNMHDLSAERANFVRAFGREPTSVETTSKGGTVLHTGEDKGLQVPAKTIADYTALKVARAEKQSYLDKETYQPNIDKLKGEIAPIDAQIGAVEEQFPQLNPNRATVAAGPTEVTRTTQDGRSAVFDANTKKFLRYGK